MWAKLGLNWDEVHTSKNATMFTGTVDYTPEEWARFEAWLDRIYADFTKKTGDARKLSPQQIDAIARGRVWTGLDARRLGLVDDLGGLTLAIGYAKAAAGIEPATGVQLKLLPAPKSPFDKVFDKLFGSDSTQIEAFKPTLKYAQTLGRQLRELGVGTDSGALTLPPMTVRY
jgi:protease-4